MRPLWRQAISTELMTPAMSPRGVNQAGEAIGDAALDKKVNGVQRDSAA